MTHEFKNGNIVKIKPEYANSEQEAQELFIIKEGSIRTDGKCLISPITGELSKLSIVPTELVSLEMLIPTGFNVEDYLNKENK